jgi:hypothetical protein
MLSSGSALVTALVLLQVQPGTEDNRKMPPLSQADAVGEWEGLCRSADELGSDLWAARLRIEKGDSSKLAIGTWDHHGRHFVGQSFDVKQMEVTAGSFHLRATSEQPYGWQVVTLRGFGRGQGRRGWLKLRMEIGGTPKDCEILFEKRTGEGGLFRNIAGSEKELNLIEKLARTHSWVKGRPTRR